MHGGKRTGSGRKRKSLPAIPDARPQKTGAPSSRDRECYGRLLVVLNQEESKGESYEIQQWRILMEAKDLRIRLDARKYLYDKRDGKATQPIEGLSDAPREITINNFIERPKRDSTRQE